VSDAPEAAIPVLVDEIYAAFLAADPGQLDSYLDPDITIWVPSEFPLALGLAGLDEMRARRPADSGVNTATSIAVHEMRVDSHEDVAWSTHVLVVQLAAGETQVMRCTQVWRRIAGRWVQVHSHEDLLPPGTAYPFADPAAESSGT
jgi:hypothetical protein